jgi:hypothetical protein
VSYEQQPPGTTFLYILDKPSTGGDTLFVNAAEAYNRLSPLFQQRLHGLRATHSAVEQANASLARGGIKRREPVVNEHPIVRTHPVTGEKALYVNPQCMSGAQFTFPSQALSYNAVLKEKVTDNWGQSPATSSASRRRSRTRSSSSCTTTSRTAPISRRASSGRSGPWWCGTTA